MLYKELFPLKCKAIACLQGYLFKQSSLWQSCGDVGLHALAGYQCFARGLSDG